MHSHFCLIDSSSAVVKHGLNTSVGSQGSPIFKECDGKLCLIAMHIGIAVDKKDNNTGNTNQGVVACKCGVLISEILKNIQGKSHNRGKMAK